MSAVTRPLALCAAMMQRARLVPMVEARVRVTDQTEGRSEGQADTLEKARSSTGHAWRLSRQDRGCAEEGEGGIYGWERDIRERNGG